MGVSKLRKAFLGITMVTGLALLPALADAAPQNGNMSGGSMQGETMQGGNMSGDTMHNTRMASKSRRTRRMRRKHRRNRMHKKMAPKMGAPHM